MQVVVRKSDVAADCACSICGQGFRLYWETGSAEEQVRAQILVRDTIHSQHIDSTSRAAHPDVPFTVPNWQGLPQFASFRRPASRTAGGRLADLAELAKLPQVS